MRSLVKFVDEPILQWKALWLVSVMTGDCELLFARRSRTRLVFLASLACPIMSSAPSTVATTVVVITLLSSLLRVSIASPLFWMPSSQLLNNAIITTSNNIDGELMVKNGLIEILKERINKYMEKSENILTYIVRIIEILSTKMDLASALKEAGMAAKVDDVQACITEKGYSQMLAWRVSQIKQRLV